MCGIAGIIQTQPSQYNKEHIKIMTDALAHRGPDGEGFWQNEDGNSLLGHRRLSVIDLSAAASQPMNYLGRYCIIHNGELYNYLELREELKKKKYIFQTASDTEVIVAAYDCWKENCVDHFDGMFAFAIWDEKEKELFAARDRFGEKPFFYFFNNGQFVFASEMKALWAAGIERKPNLKMLFNYITIGYVENPNDPDETFFENISKLPPACFLKYKLAHKELVIEKYWDLDLDNIQKNISDEDAIEHFNQLFTDSVKRRLRSDVAIGTSLSGGLDSSSVLATIANFRNAPPVVGEPVPTGRNLEGALTAFTATFPNFEKDETSYSKQVAKQFSLQQHFVSVSAENMISDWEKFSWQQEAPVGSASVFAQYKVFELAKQHNITVLLDGQGADETLAGYHKYYKWYWQELFKKRKLMGSGEIKAARELGIKETFGYKNIMASFFPDFAAVFLERQYLLHALRHNDLTKDFIRNQSREAYYTRPAHFNLNGVLYFNTCIHGLEELLRYADRNSMAHGREVRLPFLGHELVEFIFSLPSGFKIRQGWTKWLLRKAMDKKLPGEITWRRDKVGFEPPQKIWMENKGIQQAIQEAKRKLVNEKILKPESLNNKIVSKAAHDADNFDWRYLSAAVLFTPAPKGE